MKKLLELKSLDKEVRELLQTVEAPAGAYVCYHSHYDAPSFSIYTKAGEQFRILKTTVCEYLIDNAIDDQVADEIISKIEEALK